MTWTSSVPDEPGRPETEVLFDAGRGIYYTRPVLRGWSHVIWFGLSVVAGPLLLAGAHGARQITADAIYALSVSALFGVSALYHRGHWTESGRRLMQRLDHRRRRPDPRPSVFGYHEVFHVFVCVAAACQYVAITRLAG